jgi:hypothetical protein
MKENEKTRMMRNHQITRTVKAFTRLSHQCGKVSPPDGKPSPPEAKVSPPEAKVSLPDAKHPLAGAKQRNHILSTKKTNV